MAVFCCDITGIDDKTLEFFGYFLDEENEEFKVYRDKFGDAHIVAKDRPRLYVEDVNDAVYVASKRVIVLPNP